MILHSRLFLWGRWIGAWIFCLFYALAFFSLLGLAGRAAWDGTYLAALLLLLLAPPVLFASLILYTYTMDWIPWSKVCRDPSPPQAVLRSFRVR